MRKVMFPREFISRYEQSPVADVLSDFDQWMQTANYCRPYSRRHLGYVRCVLERELDLPADRRFYSEDVDRMFRSKVRPRAFAAARWAFEQYLRDRGRWIDVPTVVPHQLLIDKYTAYLRDMQGLATSSVEQKLRVIRGFLRLCCAPPRTPAELTVHDVERFIQRRARSLGRSSMQATVGTLRGFFRFCQDRGVCPPGLDNIDRPRRYRDEQPPRAIAWKLAQRLLASIDRSTRMGCRDHAVLYLMTHFGLRPGEVCALRRDDLDLRGRVLRVRQPKVHSLLTLPLSSAAIRVLERYLRYGRPRTDRPEVFLNVTAPLGPMTRSTVAGLFHRQVQLATLPLADHSPYGLRHGFAMRLLERGVGMKAIGDLLGHRAVESTAVYLRLNLNALRGVALPVPRAHGRLS